MELSLIGFETNYHGSTAHRSNNMADYVRHEVDVYNALVINGRQFDAVYQTGLSFYINDYSLPTTELELSSEAGTHKFLVLIDGLLEEDIAAGKVDLKEFQEHLPDITLKEITIIYELLIDNKVNAVLEFESMDLSNDLSDYNEEDDQPYLVLKAA